MRTLAIIAIFITASMLLFWMSLPAIIAPFWQVIGICLGVLFFAAAIRTVLEAFKRKGWIE